MAELDLNVKLDIEGWRVRKKSLRQYFNHKRSWNTQRPEYFKLRHALIYFFVPVFFLHLLASSKLISIPFLHQPLICLAGLCSVPSLQINFPEGYVSLQVQSNLIDPISSCHCGYDVEKEKKTHQQHRVRIAGLNPNNETNKQQVSSQETVVVFMVSVFLLKKKRKIMFLRLDILKCSDIFFSSCALVETPCRSGLKKPSRRQCN